MVDVIAILRKYNFWDSNTPTVGFLRENYLNKINGFIGNKLIKVLVGQRRAGKSYLLRQIILRLIHTEVNPINILYINKEFTEFDFISDNKDLQNLVKQYISVIKPVGRKYLLIDEIQDIAGWEHFVTSYAQDYTDDYEIFISGSNSSMLSGELASLLSGRYVSFQVFPFSYTEFISYLKLENSRNSYQLYMKSGGLPELFNLPDEETKKHYMSAIKDTVLLRDIIQRYNIKDARLLEDLFSFLVSNASNLISISSIVKYFSGKNRRTNYETLSNYIKHLQDAFLIHNAERFSIKGKEIISGTSKFYINDPAFKNYLYPGYDYGIGYFLENMVYLHLVQAGYIVYVGHMRNREIDFIANRNERILYLQVAYILTDISTIEREYSALDAIPDNYEKFVVSLDDIQMPDRNGVHHIRAWDIPGML